MLGLKSAKVGVVELHSLTNFQFRSHLSTFWSIPLGFLNEIKYVIVMTQIHLCPFILWTTALKSTKKMSSIFAMWTCHLYVALFHRPLHKECIPLYSLWHGWPTLAILFWPFSFFAPKTIYLALQCIQFEWRWWRLFLKRVVHTKGDTCGFCFASKEFFLACKERVTF